MQIFNDCLLFAFVVGLAGSVVGALLGAVIVLAESRTRKENNKERRGI